MYAYAEPSPFPPSYEGDPFAYAFGLFGDTVAASLSLALLLGYLFEGHRKRQINRILRNPVVESPVPHWSVYGAYRNFIILTLLFIVMRTLPDALWMLLWGEVTQGCIEVLLRIDLILDGLSLVPFSAAIILWAWTRQVIPQRLISQQEKQGLPKLQLRSIAPNLKVIAAVIIISILVTIGKASA